MSGRKSRHDSGTAGNIEQTLTGLWGCQSDKNGCPRTEYGWNEVTLVNFRRGTRKLPSLLLRHHPTPRCP